MIPPTVEPPETMPSALVFGPLTRLSPEQLFELRRRLTTNRRLSKLYATVQDLPSLWSKLLEFDPDLLQIPGKSHLHGLSEWFAEGGPFPFRAPEVPLTVAIPLNFLFQITQYLCFTQSLRVDNAHSLVIENLKQGGVQGFCIGLLGAITVSASSSEKELVETAICALRLAVCIGVCVDKDAEIAKTRCVSVKRPQKQARNKKWDQALNVLQDFPEAYISGVTDENTMTVTVLSSEVSSLAHSLTSCGFLVQNVAVYGRFHCSVYTSVVDKLVELFKNVPDFSFPTPAQLQLDVRSAVDGTVIRNGDLVRHVLDNTLLHPVDWYHTLELTMAAIPREKKCVALAGASNHFPTSLLAASEIRLLSLPSIAELQPERGPEAYASNVYINGQSEAKRTQLSGFPSHSIAVVGMAGRFPGADSVDELWDVLSAGRSMVDEAPERIGLEHVTGDFSQTRWWGNFLDDFDTFDHKFFKKSAREAIAWDPQQRKLLEVTYEALESSGYFGAGARSETNDFGCYIGSTQNNYVNNLSKQPPTAYATVGTGRAFLSGTLSHHFGWTGPAITIDTACSSSLVAVHSACRAIWSGECSRAIAGGTNIITCPIDYRDLKAAGFLSPTGQCRPFDADADGYCRSEAVGVVVLKSLAVAIEEGDHIYGIMLGSAVNQNFKESHITVPNAASQVDLYRKAMAMSHVLPEDVTYVEAHGTGTSVGDPIEVRGLREAFGSLSRASTLYFSSIKGNIGHAESAAGIAGLVKVLLSLQHGQIPQQASFQSLNPNIPALEPDHLAVPRHLTDWQPSKRVACVSSYGAAGSNSAVMICGAPVPELHLRTSIPHDGFPLKLPLILSAASKISLSLYCQKLLERVQNMRSERHSDFRISDLLFNLADRADHSLDNVLSTSVTSMQDLEMKLSACASDGSGIITISSPKPVVLLFAGQERNFVGLSDDVYKSSLIFRHHLDICQRLSLSLGLHGIYPAVFQQTPVLDLITLHIALFAVQYSSAMSWIDCGLKVQAVLGHSFGQLTALCVSGVLSLPDTLRLVAGRASLIQKYWGAEPGSLISVQADRQTVLDILDRINSQIDYAEIACLNGPKSVVVVGSAKAVETLEAFVANHKALPYPIRTKRLEVTHGFHSKFTEPLLPHLAGLASKLEWKRPTIHFETCDEVSMDCEPDHRIVTSHTRSPVFFQQAVERLEKKYPRITWIEAGWGSSVTQLARGCVQQPEYHSLFAPQLTTSHAPDSLVDVTTRLWSEGHKVQYWLFHRTQRSQYRFLSLPPYQFQKTRHWHPYQDWTHRGKAQSHAQPENSRDNEFLRLVKGDELTEVTFCISPKSKRFQALVGGHIVSGHAMVPASLYIEISATAALMLQEDLQATTWVPSVNDLAMKLPVGLDQDSDITMVMRRLKDPWPAWSFTITLQSQSTSKQKPVGVQEITTGFVHLNKRTDSRIARRLKRFETLTGYHRWEHIMRHQDAEIMHGRHIYRAFNQVVRYSEAYKGINTIACLENEAACKIRISPDAKDQKNQHLAFADTPMVDSFLQIGGFQSNYFNVMASENSVFVCNHIDQVEFGPGFSPDAHDWLVFSNMITAGEDHISVDAYVFDVRSKSLVFLALGLDFARIPRSSFAQIMSSLRNPDAVAEAKARHSNRELRQVTSNDVASTNISSRPNNKKDNKTRILAEVIQIVASVADVEEQEVSGQTTLVDIGVDSLGATEIISDLKSKLNVSMDLPELLVMPDLEAIVAHVNSKLGLQVDDVDAIAQFSTEDTNVRPGKLSNKAVTTSSGNANGTINKSGLAPSIVIPSDMEKSKPGRPTIPSAYRSFDTVRLSYDQLGLGLHALDYWSGMYPDDARLMQAYVTEAFKKLGCDLATLRPGDAVPEIRGILPRHRQLVRQLHRFLEDQSVIVRSDSGFVRSKVVMDSTVSEQIFQEIESKHPQNSAIRHLSRAVGSQLADCLVGDVDAIQILFGNKPNKKRLDELYEHWPMLVTATQLLASFLRQAFSDGGPLCSAGTFRILEVGAGTGGTTRYIVDFLKQQGVQFEYHFTDISKSLIQKAKKSFKDINNMTFGVLDIEQDPPAEFMEAFHIIVSTNCIHATRNISHSLSNLRKMLREDGAVALIEMTRTLYVFDLIVGLLEGWWLFEDGRSHALVDEKRWAQAFAEAGFSATLWSEGQSLESKTVRVIAGFKKGAPQMRAEVDSHKKERSVDVQVQEVVYKKVGSQEIHADIYCPADADPVRKMPIALMIHGGSHIIFSRKDVRPPQTRIMLEMGLLPVSLDHRLCPESKLVEGPMTDVCDALAWARTELPYIQLKNPSIKPDPDRVVVVGWSSGGQLAMSTGWTAPQRGLEPPSAILAFYCPTDYEDEWWQTPNQPIGAEDQGDEYTVLEAVQDTPITNYSAVGAWEPLSDPRIRTDPRCRIVLHINWKAQTLPVVIGGLPSKNRAASERPDVKDWNCLPQPPLEEIRKCSPLAQVKNGNYTTPTFMVHGMADDLIPYQQSLRTVAEMKTRGIDAQLVLVPDAPHICDTSSDPKSKGWQAVLKAYEWLAIQLESSSA